MILKLPLIVVVTWILLFPQGKRQNGGVQVWPPKAPVQSTGATPELTSEERAKALEDAVARWRAERNLEAAQPQGACRKNYE